MNLRTRTWLARAAACLLVAAAGAASAADYPSKAITLIVPFPAGGTTDSIARIVGAKLTERLHTQVVIDNRTGAGGNIGAVLLAHAAGDGYTLMMAPPGPLTINFNLYKDLQFDPRKFVPISMVANMPNVLVVGPSVKATSLAELIADAKANPGKLTFASQGNGTTSHLTGIYFASKVGINIAHVPYKGSAPALNDLIAGRIDMMFDNITTTLPFHNAKKANILAVATKKRIPSAPNVPTMAEAGLPGFESGTWVALVAPEGTPPEIAARLSKEVAEIIKLPEVTSKFAGFGADPVGGTPAQTGALLHEESMRWKSVIDAAHVTIE
ncbi:MAG TPA: tripartite tricarboxylate transporter substrate binding protein [Burkholderiaceae bacterium]|jgi:tripartite-type tricarboxylate transporter receptor subunit TctC